MRKKYTPQTRYDRDTLYTCDYGDFTAKIKIFGYTKALFCGTHLVAKDDDELYLQSIAHFYELGYSQGLDDMQDKIEDKIQETFFNS